MFRAIRSWWTGGSGKVTLRLFLFEFVVVVAGVLVAQWLAGWAADRAVQRQVEEERARLDFELARARHTAIVWRAAIPCLRDRVSMMMRAASDPSQRFSERELEMPRAALYSVEPISADIARPFRERYGDERTDIYSAATSFGDSNVALIRDIRAEWQKFGLLERDVGPLDAPDRATLRSAGVKLRWSLKSLGDQQLRVEEVARKLGIAPIGSGNVLSIPDHPIKRCDEIWRNRHIWHVGG